jgi:hypothetical protein
LRECQLFGIGENDVLAGLRIEHHLGGLELRLVILEAADIDRRRRHEAMAIGDLPGLDAVDGELHDIRLFGIDAEGRDDGVQRPHPLQRAGSRRARAPAHRFRPRKRAHDHRQHIGEHVQRGAAGLLDQRDIEIALLRIALDFGLIERG